MSAPWYQAAFGAHYPLLYGHRDQAEAAQCLDLLPRLAPLTLGGPVLDLGCGDGRHLRQLAAAGYPVVGLDLSAHLLAAARRAGSTAPRLVRGDMRTLPCRDASCGGVLSLFTAFGYFGPLPANEPVVEEVARVLEPGGHWFLDYVDCEGVRRELADGAVRERRRELGPLAVREARRLAAGGELVQKEVELLPLTGRLEEAAVWGVGPAGIRYTESVALFGVPEMENLARSNGLHLVASAGSYSGSPLGQGSRWILVFRKDEKLRSGRAGGDA